MSELTKAEIYWDTADPENEGWAWRVRHGDVDESGPWDHNLPDVANETRMQEAVALLAHEHDVTIDPGPVAVDTSGTGHASWEAN